METQLDQSWIAKDGHDYASPSRLNLCLHCPGYPRLMRETEMAFTETSEAAQRGIDLHAYTVDVLTGKMSQEDLKNTVVVEDYEQVMWCVERTKEVIARFPTGIVQYEVQLDLSQLGISGGKNGCRIDCLIVVPGVGIIVIDWKFGRIWVTPPEWNIQTQAYGWGANNQFGGNVESIILQPQSPEGRDHMNHVFESDEFKEIGERIKGIVSATRKEDAPLIRGQHCHKLFCPLQLTVCPLHKKSILEIPDGKNVAAYFESLSPEDRNEFYEKILVIKKIADHCEMKCKEMAIEHNIEIAGYEVGPGRSNYTCGDTEKFLDVLSPFAMSKGIKPDDLTHDPVPRLPKSKSDVHKILGQSKAVQEAVKSLYVETPGSPTLKKIKF